MIIFTLGPKGTYSEQTSINYFGENCKITLLPTISDIFEAVHNDSSAFGVVPLENIIEGTVRETYDLLNETDLKIWDIITTPLDHALLAQNQNFSIIASHPQALAQSRKFIRDKYPDLKILTVESTAESCELANNNELIAAIASSENINNYANLKIFAPNTSDHQNNQTDFAIIANRANPKTCSRSIAIIEPINQDEPGLLIKILFPFQEQNVNLTKLESRPNKLKPGSYLFFVEFEGDARQARARKIFTYLEKDLKLCTIKTVGGKAELN